MCVLTKLRLILGAHGFWVSVVVELALPPFSLGLESAALISETKRTAASASRATSTHYTTHTISVQKPGDIYQALLTLRISKGEEGNPDYFSELKVNTVTP